LPQILTNRLITATEVTQWRTRAIGVGNTIIFMATQFSSAHYIHTALYVLVTLTCPVWVGPSLMPGGHARLFWLFSPKLYPIFTPSAGVCARLKALWCSWPETNVEAAMAGTAILQVYWLRAQPFCMSDLFTRLELCSNWWKNCCSYY
jgi:hypothetical protein